VIAVAFAQVPVLVSPPVEILYPIRTAFALPLGAKVPKLVYPDGNDGIVVEVLRYAQTIITSPGDVLLSDALVPLKITVWVRVTGPGVGVGVGVGVSMGVGVDVTTGVGVRVGVGVGVGIGVLVGVGVGVGGGVGVGVPVGVAVGVRLAAATAPAS
jgi:hypothetical protein